MCAHVFMLYASFSTGIGDLFSNRDGTAVMYYTNLWGVYFVLCFCKFLYDRYLQRRTTSRKRTRTRNWNWQWDDIITKENNFSITKITMKLATSKNFCTVTTVVLTLVLAIGDVCWT